MKVKTLEKKVNIAKSNYAEALSNLEQISDEIHKSRKATYLGMDPLGISCLSPDGTTASSSTNQDTGSADSYAGEEYLRLPDKIGPNSSPVMPYRLHSGCYRKLEEISPVSPCLAGSTAVAVYRSEYLPENVENPHYAPEPPYKYIPGCFPNEDLEEEWSEISLAPEAPSTENSSTGGQGPVESVRSTINESSTSSDTFQASNQSGQPIISQWISSSAPRRQSIDTFISGGLATGERVKEILSQGIMKLNISSLSERRNSEPRRPTSNIKKKGKKAPSPLDRAQHLSNTDTDDAGGSSDTDSLASVEMLTDDQISSLMLDQELKEASNDIIAAITSKIK
ncbi:hypothetical protein O3M35_010716 [Rhynocoris fuscipes]|uniref:Uncharacterized protein n=1 Tax=Rhynocoris fuscipes TaxID=488301 RepID=A0AAW1D2R7_9HEMI